MGKNWKKMGKYVKNKNLFLDFHKKHAQLMPHVHHTYTIQMTGIALPYI